MIYLILFIIAFISATLFPLGSEALLIYDITQGYNIYLLLLFATLGNSLGSVVNYFLGLKNVISKRLPKAKIEGSLASIYIGDPLNSTPKKPLNNLILEALHANAALNKFYFINVETFGILDDTSLGKDYDWTTSPYPMPSELIDEMKTRLLAKEFNIIAQSNPDKTTDGNDKGSIGGNSQQQQE